MYSKYYFNCVLAKAIEFKNKKATLGGLCITNGSGEISYAETHF